MLIEQPLRYAPIVLFAYARPDHFHETVKSLLANDISCQSELYVFCDAAKSDGDRELVEQVRGYADGISGFYRINVIKRERNYGLAASIIDGVTYVLGKHGSVIVMEDDLFVSPYFLKYMNDALDLYRDNNRVASIHGYCYPVAESLPETFFLKGADCWGWATWTRAWDKFEPDGKLLLDQLKLKSLTRAFDMGGAYPFTKMLKNQAKGKNNSWAIRWHAQCFLNNMLTLYPGQSLVNNIGLDGSGTHCGPTDDFAQSVSLRPILVQRQNITEHEQAARIIARFLARHTSVSSRLTRAWGRLKGRTVAA